MYLHQDHLVHGVGLHDLLVFLFVELLEEGVAEAFLF